LDLALGDGKQVQAMMHSTSKTGVASQTKNWRKWLPCLGDAADSICIQTIQYLGWQMKPNQEKEK